MATEHPLAFLQSRVLRILLAISLLVLQTVALAQAQAVSLKEATAHDLQLAFGQNKLTSRQLTKFYLNRIRRLNPLLRGVIEVNPDALCQADRADRERKVKPYGSLSALHGIPILLKDNIATKDKMNTTAGSFALLGSVVPRDAGVVARLRRAGAVLLGKASLSEWAHYRFSGNNSGWCARSGQGKVSQTTDPLFYSGLSLQGLTIQMLSCEAINLIEPPYLVLHFVKNIRKVAHVPQG